MAATAYIQTVFEGGVIPEGYFDNDNVEFLRNKVREVLRREFVQDVNVGRDSVVRVMQRVLEERRETVPRMNERVVMYITNEVRVHQLEVNRNLKWEAHFVESQRLYDPTTERGPDLGSIKLANRLGRPMVGGTLRFHFA